MSNHRDEAVIDLIYSGVSETAPWKSLANYCREYTNSTVCWPFFHWIRQEEYAELDVSDANGLVVALRKQYMDHFVALDPVPYSSLQPGRLYPIEDFITRGKLEASRYYREFLHPAGLDHFVTLHVAEPSGFKAWLNVARASHSGPYSPAELRFLESLIPHLQRALALFANLKRMELERDIYRDLVENLTIGALAIDREGGVVSCNRAAERLMGATELVSVVNRRLRFRSARQQDGFNAALQRIVAGDVKVAALALGENSLDHGGLGLLIRPLGPFRNFGDGSLPSAVIYLSDAALKRIAPASLVAELFDLTTAEAELAILLARGSSLSEAATTMKIVENSARTYLKRIFAKTGLHRQTELVTLILQSVAALSAG